ncbi:hypothetical protein HDU93_000866 [Gonapodya sp. JEL0774]|nr:hypothetical protein HDU93_000866 [Gonapodya sp. JEL0774]
MDADEEEAKEISCVLYEHGLKKLVPAGSFSIYAKPHQVRDLKSLRSIIADTIEGSYQNPTFKLGANFQLVYKAQAKGQTLLLDKNIRKVLREYVFVRKPGKSFHLIIETEDKPPIGKDTKQRHTGSSIPKAFENIQQYVLELKGKYMCRIHYGSYCYVFQPSGRHLPLKDSLQKIWAAQIAAGVVTSDILPTGPHWDEHYAILPSMKSQLCSPETPSPFVSPPSQDATQPTLLPPHVDQTRITSVLIFVELQTQGTLRMDPPLAVNSTMTWLEALAVKGIKEHGVSQRSRLVIEEKLDGVEFAWDSRIQDYDIGSSQVTVVVKKKKRYGNGQGPEKFFISSELNSDFE